MIELELDLQLACDAELLPSSAQIKSWILLTLQNAGYQKSTAELTVRIVDEAESQSLNASYRGKDKPTNVLSFPFEAPPQLPTDLLGDLVVCAPVVSKEAKEQQKSLQDHWAHMLIHGCLHLLGYDHIEDGQAQVMESLEIKILSQLSIANPYL